MNQKQKLGFFLTALVALSVFTLGMLGLNAIRTELTTYQLSEQQGAARAVERLAGLINQELMNIRAPLQEAIEDTNQQGVWALRCVHQKRCLEDEEQRLDMIVIYDSEGRQSYPPEEVTGQLYPENQALKKLANALSSARQTLASVGPETQRQGIWTALLSSAGHQLLFCWRDPQNTTFCAALNHDWMIEKISTWLTTYQPENKIVEEHFNLSYRLLNVEDKIIWQSAAAETSNIIAARQLTRPLYFLRLEAIKTNSAPSPTYPLTIIALTLPLIALAIGLAYQLNKTQNQALKDADQRVAFASSVSHELRTPLTNLQLYASLILNKTRPGNEEKPNGRDKTSGALNQNSEAIRKYAKVIAAETTRLSELVNNALTITLDNQPAERQKTALIPDHLITETISHLSPLLGEHINNITYRLGADRKVLIDKSSLEQITVNLIDNARKYAPGERIRITTNLGKTHLKLTIRDWGPNFRQNDIPALFTPFYQDETSTSYTTRENGFGLGLAVCKQLAEAANGSIKAEAANPGARFIVTLEVEDITTEKNRQRDQQTCTS